MAMEESVRTYHGWLGEAAIRLDCDMATGYTKGFEYTLASEFIAQADEETKRDVRKDLVLGVLSGSDVLGLVLDECGGGSYELLSQMAKTICDTAEAQEGAPGLDASLLHLIAGDLGSEVDLKHRMRDIATPIA
jgi:hypothetical protein